MNDYTPHNLFKQGISQFLTADPHLRMLSQLKYQYSPDWWQALALDIPGIYILTGGRQVGKSTSCKLLIKHCLEKHLFDPQAIFYLPCDEVFDAKELSRIIREHLDLLTAKSFLLIIDEITYVKEWDRVIKSLADEGYFQKGLCLLTGSDTLILKEAAMRFPGRRGQADTVDFHLYPLTFKAYVDLVAPQSTQTLESLEGLFKQYLQCGGYLRGINDLAQHKKITQATLSTYEQWIRGDFLKHGKNENYLMTLLKGLLKIGVSQISYSSLTQKIGLMSKDTCIDYLNLLERMDVIFNLQAFDQNTKQGFPRKDRKFHFFDPFIYQVVYQWLKREGYLNSIDYENILVESCVASHCRRLAPTYYFKGQGEVDIILIQKNVVKAIEIKWSKQIRPHDLKQLKQFKNAMILGKSPLSGQFEHIQSVPVYDFLYHLQ